MLLVRKQEEAILITLDGSWWNACKIAHNEDKTSSVESMIKSSELTPFYGEIKITV